MMYQANGLNINFEQPLVMAIVNLTPDSFYDGGKFDGINDILSDVNTKIKAGADIIDIGAASSRPGSKMISEDEEWKRLKEPLLKIRQEYPETLISVDTYRSRIAEMSFELGANIINDISGGDLDLEMFKTVAKLNIPYIMMHMKGTPENMQIDPTYEDVVNEVIESFKNKIKVLNDLNFKKIIIDPGFGFGKSLTDNYKLLKHLSKFTGINYPVLTGVSRKSMINKVIKTNPVTALNGTSVINTIALLNGSRILRVHDVLEAKQAIQLVEFYKNA